MELKHEAVSQLTLNDFNLADEVKDILLQFHIETKKFSNADSLCSEYIPVLKVLMECTKRKGAKAGSQAKAFGAKLYEGLHTRLIDLAEKDYIKEAMTLDYRFSRDLFFLSKSEWEAAEYNVIEKLYEKNYALTQEEGDVVEQQTENSFNEEDPWNRPTSSVSATTNDDFDAFVTIVKVRSWFTISMYLYEHLFILQAEFDRFQGMKPKKANKEKGEKPIHPISYWFSNKEVLPNLAKAAEFYFITPSTSIESERFFSKVTLLYSNQLRNSISSGVAENILLLKCFYNLDNDETTSRFQEEEASDDDELQMCD